ncbi:SpoIIE family protein phosphatase [Georgenia sp. M64]|uniref:SpoIIE family protein phosphatase n=1 Tax=Georgenia sp. M64 TaxID=3120520 RepID=UPI0030DEC3DB
MDDSLLAPQVPVDLDNCAREPIHIPGSIQPRGLLLALAADDLTVLHASDNTEGLLGIPARELLGGPLAGAVGTEAAAVLAARFAEPGEVRDRNPLTLTVRGASVDAILHRPPRADGARERPDTASPVTGTRTVAGTGTGAQGAGGTAAGVVVVELEAVSGDRPLTYTGTYQAVRGAVESLNRAHSLTALYDTTAREVRELTGFDRVMVYRFDEEYNGEVVAEARRGDLNPFVGLHYPATDIPSQARALYERSWIRLISDVGYTPAPIVPTLDPRTGAPLDLTFATLRSVSPIHLEYLQNMGVTASMSISLLKDGSLWGLIACHHYSGPFAPPYGVRAAAEFLGSALSLRLVAQVEDERIAAARRVARDLAGLVAASRDEAVPLAEALTADDAILELLGADGVVVRAQGDTRTLGHAPGPAGRDALLAWAGTTTGDYACTTSLVRDVPEVAALVPDVAGVLAITMSGGDAVAWLRREVVHSVDWGGDPHNKALARLEGDTVRLSPRRSFDRWRETVRGSSLPWTDDQADTARLLRRHVVEAMYTRTQRDARAAETLQSSALPAHLPQVPGWALDARYAPADGGRVGGDWYDALTLPDGRLAVVVGDVAGHGLHAASTMGQLRNGLRALLVRDPDPAAAVTALDELVRATMPGEMATLLVAVVDPGTGAVDYVRAGHLPPVLLDADGDAVLTDDVHTTPVGFVTGHVTPGRLTVAPGGSLILFTDGLVERRGTSLRSALESLREAFGQAHAAAAGRAGDGSWGGDPDGGDGPDEGAGPAGGVDLDAVVARVRDPRSDDDATVVVVRRVRLEAMTDVTS